MHNLPVHNRRHHLPSELPAVERSVARQGPRLGGVERPALLGVEYRDVGETAAGQGSASAEIEDASGAGGEEFYDARQRNFVLAVKLRDGQGQCSLEASDAEGC